jgi:hypothetical protein
MKKITQRTSTFPDTQSLAAGLKVIFGMDLDNAGGVKVLSRLRNDLSSSHGSEVIICRVINNRKLRLFCKYQTLTEQKPKGLMYEGYVYRDILSRMDIETPKFFGTYRPELSDQFWLVTEYLDNAEPLNYSSNPRAIQLAATWLGHFHRQTEGFGDTNSPDYLYKYDRDRYLGTIQCGLERAASAGNAAPWQDEFQDSWNTVTDQLVRKPVVIIHGDYFPHNIMIRQNRICPVDWELSALGIGEIDLASLIMGYEQKTVSECAEAYALARWQKGNRPLDFLKILQAAIIFVYCRWIAAPPQLSRNGATRWALREVQALAKKAQLIQ